MVRKSCKAWLPMQLFPFQPLCVELFRTKSCLCQSALNVRINARNCTTRRYKSRYFLCLYSVVIFTPSLPLSFSLFLYIWMRTQRQLIYNINQMDLKYIFTVVWDSAIPYISLCLYYPRSWLNYIFLKCSCIFLSINQNNYADTDTYIWISKSNGKWILKCVFRLFLKRSHQSILY